MLTCRVFYNNHRVVFADDGRTLVQEVQPSVGNAGVNMPDFGFRLLPVIAVLLFAAQSLLVLSAAVLRAS